MPVASWAHARGPFRVRRGGVARVPSPIVPAVRSFSTSLTWLLGALDSSNVPRVE